jgi:hypothetical protein
MSPLRENWYVYYPAPTSPGSALPLLRAMQAQLTWGNGISARVEERVDSGNAATWMEVYEGVTDPDEFAANLQAAVVSTGLAQHTLARHVERFRRL